MVVKNIKKSVKNIKKPVKIIKKPVKNIKKPVKNNKKKGAGKIKDFIKKIIPFRFFNSRIKKLVENQQVMMLHYLILDTEAWRQKTSMANLKSGKNNSPQKASM